MSRMTAREKTDLETLCAHLAAKGVKTAMSTSGLCIDLPGEGIIILRETK